jgi:hypothetical protein
MCTANRQVPDAEPPDEAAGPPAGPVPGPAARPKARHPRYPLMNHLSAE